MERKRSVSRSYSETSSQQDQTTRPSTKSPKQVTKYKKTKKQISQGNDNPYAW